MPTNLCRENYNPALDEFARKWGFAQMDSPWGINALCLVETVPPFQVLHAASPRALALRMMGAVKTRPAKLNNIRRRALMQTAQADAQAMDAEEQAIMQEQLMAQQMMEQRRIQGPPAQ